MGDTQRLKWMDALRGAAILLVVFHHADGALNIYGTGSPAIIATLDEAVAPFRMPVLMFLSGMLLSRSLAKGAGAFFRGKLAGIGWPYLVWSVVILAVTGALSLPLLLRVFVYPPTVLWYLWFLLAFYVGAFILRRIPAWLLIAASLVISGFIPDLARADRFFYLFAFFMLGHLASQTKEHWMPWVKRPLVLAVSTVAVLTLAGLSAAGVPVQYEPLFAWGIVAAIIVAMPVFTAVSGWRAGRWLGFVGRNSLVFYVAHWPAICAVAIGLTSSGVNTVVLFVACLIAGVGVGYALVAARPYTPWLYRFPAGDRKMSRPPAKVG